MPLIDITRHPNYRLRRHAVFPVDTEQVLFSELGPALPDLFVEHREELVLGDTPATGVQVQHHQFGQADVNTVGLWVKIQFLEAPCIDLTATSW